jgi:hypothetical protein
MDDFTKTTMELIEDLASSAGYAGHSFLFSAEVKSSKAALLAHLEGGTRDAARYRWLRDISTPAICAFYLSVGKAFEGVKFSRETVDEAIDAQIDASRAASGAGEG